MSTKLKSFFIIISIFIQLFFSLSCQLGQSSEFTEQQQRLIRELNDWLIPLGASPLELTDNELSFLDQLSFAKIVGLGEATHGTREFFQMKHRIFQYLVENLNHKAFGFEADFAECLYLNNYVTKGEGDLEDLMKTKMHFWTWRTEEVKELLEWMKDYNMGKSDKEKIHYVGLDCQFTDLHIDLIREYLEPLLPGFWETASPILDQVNNFTPSEYRLLSSEEYVSLKAQLESLETQLAANKDQLVADSSSSEYQITSQLFRTFRQAFIVLYHIFNNINDNTNWRDRFMAENALWIADFFGPDTKITLWAHNFHVAKYNSYRSGGVIGYNLHTALSNLYQVVGFGFSQGKFNAGVRSSRTEIDEHEITAEPKQDSVNMIFHNAANSNFAFHLDAIPAGSEWENWLTAPVLFLNIGALFNGRPQDYYWDTDLPALYNWIIYFDTTTASRLIQRQSSESI
ncbi:MAG: erythromycin esterase family protein [Candidatus Aminicenantes bacterium]|jgi:erythromycin esterase